MLLPELPELLPDLGCRHLITEVLCVCVRKQSCRLDFAVTIQYHCWALS